MPVSGLGGVWGCGGFSVGRYSGHITETGDFPIEDGLGFFEPGHTGLIVHGARAFDLLFVFGQGIFIQ